ncbi:hypothetical protein PVA45_07855 (plasmid) [Entomospira entomophila]|uniref:Uncharacterized protein n=1 Tax=Entomospira entomophila TaxID=2719988 RepID=A0A968GA54_9SPIO|nr:hypothetical protein [Entomospira entomophilus]NIZ41418.1 hypothetical protein [Entomospira entomophilus]WDI36368.1 hypothetical protein PVA45_07855 [Entomospira entomophilus]
MHHDVVQFILASLACRSHNSQSYQWLTPILIDDLIAINLDQEPIIPKPAINSAPTLHRDLQADGVFSEEMWLLQMIQFVSPTPQSVQRTFQRYCLENGAQALQWWHRILWHSGSLPAEIRHQRSYARWHREQAWVDVIAYVPTKNHRVIQAIYGNYDGYDDPLTVQSLQDRIILLPLFEHQALLQAQALPAIYQHMTMTLQSHGFHRTMHFDHFAHMLTMSDLFPHHYIGFAPSLFASQIQSYWLGGARFAIQEASARRILTSWYAATEVAIYRVQWPITTLRLRSQDADALAMMATRMSSYWRSFGRHRDPQGSMYTVLSLVYQDQGDWVIDLLLWHDEQASPLRAWQQLQSGEYETFQRDYFDFYALLGTIFFPVDGDAMHLSSRDTETMTRQFYQHLEPLALIPDERSWYQWECYLCKKFSTASW